MKRLLQSLLLALLILTLLAGGAGLLLNDSAGLSWLIRQPWVQTLLPGRLTVQRIEGGLFGDLRLFGVHYRDRVDQLAIDRLVLRWRPAALLWGRVRIRSLLMAGVRYRALAESPGPLPDLRPPLPLELQQVRLAGLSMVAVPGATPLALQRVVFRGRWDSAGVSLRQLDIRGSGLDLRLRGQLKPAGRYPLALEGTVGLAPEGLPRLALSGHLSGDLRRLQLALAAEGAYQGRLEGRIDTPLERPQWQGRLQITRLPAIVSGGGLPPDLRWLVRARGDAAQAHASLEIRETNAPPTDGAVLAAELALTFQDLRWRAEGGWERLRWPLLQAPWIDSGKGRFELQGEGAAYRFEVEGDARGADIPAGHWTLTGEGDGQGLQLRQIRAELLGGHLKGSGRVTWMPAVDWRLRLDAEQLDPGRMWREWPGTLGLRLVAAGGERSGQGWLSLAVEGLQGRLRGLRVTGRGGIEQDAGGVRLQTVRLRSGSASLQLDGMLSPRRDLSWSLDAPSLGDLLPGAEGRFRGEGRVAGNGPLPVLQGKLAGGEICWRAFHLGQFDLDLDIDPARDSRVAFEARQIALAGERIENASLSLLGPMDDHEIRVRLQQKQRRLAVVLQGGLEPAPAHWRGRVVALDLQDPLFAGWRLQRPAALDVAAGALTLAPLCLQRQQGGELCSEARWVPGGGRLSADLRALPLAILKPLLPEDLTQLEGQVQGELGLELGAPVTARLRLEVTPGELSYLVDAGHRVHLKYRGGMLVATLDRQRLVADWQLEVGDSGASGALDIPRRTLLEKPLEAPLQGTARFQLRQLGIFSALFPELQETRGSITGELRLDGVIGAPRVRGAVELTMPSARLPAVGITLREITLRLQGDGSDRLRIDGAVVSGPGRLQLDGYLQLDRDRGWPARLKLSGRRFMAVDLPDARLLLSPALQLTHDRTGLAVTGTLAIPEGRLVLDWIPTTARRLSPDVVVVDAEGNPERNGIDLPLRARITVILGDKVHFRGFGLNADLGGRLTLVSEPGRLLTGNGELAVTQGSFRALGQELEIERGRLYYAGGPLNNPGLDIKASREIGDAVVGVQITGTARRPGFTGFSSDPNLTSEDITSLLLTGHRKGEGDASNTRAYFGANITDRFSIGTRTSMETDQKEFVGRYRLSRRWSIETTSSSEKSGAELVYTIELE